MFQEIQTDTLHNSMYLFDNLCNLLIKFEKELNNNYVTNIVERCVYYNMYIYIDMNTEGITY